MIRVIEDHVPQYPDPVRGRAGERWRLGHVDDEYPGWIWATDLAGRSGWAPIVALARDGEHGVLLEDYEATELDARAGEMVEATRELDGWWWCHGQRGAGWLPAAKLGFGERRDGAIA
jgi:hypothetical protein